LKTVRVATNPPYDVRIGRGLLGSLTAETERFTRCALLTDDVVAPLYLRRLEPFRPPSTVVPAGEASKNLARLEQTLDFMAESDLDRGSCLVALGGGVIGDLGGLAASLYMRGIAVVQVPTTLLAQVDASVGGKTAIDLRAGRNLAGTFHQPAVVLADTETLSTIPGPEFRSGLGEVVKSAILEGEAALLALEQESRGIGARDKDVLEETVARCVRFKAAVVARDPSERAERQALNLGHTFAHAIEHAAGHGTIPHGVAVAVGLMLSLRASREAGLLSDASLPGRVERLLSGLGLPTDLASLRGTCPGLPEASRIAAAMRHDKKGRAGSPRFVLLQAAGVPRIDVEIDPGRITDLIARSAENPRSPKGLG